MHTSISINVAAPARTVFELARQVPRWPELLPHYTQVTVRSHDGEVTVARMRALRPLGSFGIPVAWMSRIWSDVSDDADLRLRFLHVGGPTRGMDVTWHIRPRSPVSCSVTIDHVFSRRLPLLGPDAFPRLVDRFFVRPIAGRTLATFKALAEERA